MPVKASSPGSEKDDNGASPVPHARAGKVLARQAQNYYHPRSIVGAEYYHVVNLWFSRMEEKARLTILIDPAKKKAFEELCSAQDTTSSQKVRQLIRQYLEKHGVPYEPVTRKAAEK